MEKKPFKKTEAIEESEYIVKRKVGNKYLITQY